MRIWNGRLEPVLAKGNGLARVPTRTGGIGPQFAIRQMPERTLRQDVPSCPFMAADALDRPFVIDDRSDPDFEEEGDELPPPDKRGDNRPLRADRTGRMAR